MLYIKGTWYTRSPKTLIFYILSDIFNKLKPRCIKNLNDTFSTKGPSMGKVKSKWKNATWLNVQKVTFSISTPPPGGAFELLLHFSYVWNIAQKVSFRFLIRWVLTNTPPFYILVDISIRIYGLWHEILACPDFHGFSMDNYCKMNTLTLCNKIFGFMYCKYP